MFRMSFVILLLFISAGSFAQQKFVHGKDFNLDCSACHTAENWNTLKDTLQFDHNKTDFRLTGQHADVKCVSCHTTLVFNEAPQNCESCHTDIHQGSVGFDCARCHDTNSWLVKDISRVHELSRFPLLGVHKVTDCYECHETESLLNFKPLGVSCFDCHSDKYYATTNPNHVSAGFDTECQICHSQAAWTPAAIYNHDDLYFPIYSGEHSGEWNNCTDCHTIQGNYTEFTCLNCHEHNKTDTDAKHGGINGYVYESVACYACHPNGSEDDRFNHSLTNFPIDGAHTALNCESCHANGYADTPSECSACHQTNYDATTNPNHQSLGIGTNCLLCHTTAPGWSPARFPEHDNYFQLLGAHTALANDCASCHNGNYVNTPNTCYACHESAYNATTDPPHQSAQFPTDCEACHTQTAWEPATFEHDGQYFPIFSGEHNGEWNSCSDCHTDATNYANFSCINCHEHNQADTDSDHEGISGYVYESRACYSCHPTGSSDDGFNHALTNFPLEGAHATTNCESCHANGYAGTPTNCSACHESNYDATTNPNHQSLGIGTDCQLCHTSNPGWSPAQFPEHDNFYQLLGAHTALANDCASCHNGDYVNTPNTCYACHESAYNATTDPPHQSAQFPTECETCHSQTAWEPSTFEHDGQYFPIYSGEHNGEWNSCSDCHTDATNYANFSCIDCHEHNQSDTDSDHEGVSGYVYESQACYACHPNGDSDKRIFKRLKNER